MITSGYYFKHQLEPTVYKAGISAWKTWWYSAEIDKQKQKERRIERVRNMNKCIMKVILVAVKKGTYQTSSEK